jgi:hypothetical protein
VVAVRYPDGRHAVVVWFSAQGSVEIRGLPDGQYAIIRVVEQGPTLAEVSVEIAGSALKADMPAAGVLAVRAVQ